MGNVKVFHNPILTTLDRFTAIIANKYTPHTSADFLHHFPFFTNIH